MKHLERKYHATLLLHKYAKNRSFTRNKHDDLTFGSTLHKKRMFISIYPDKGFTWNFYLLSFLTVDVKARKRRFPLKDVLAYVFKTSRRYFLEIVTNYLIELTTVLSIVQV